MCMVFLCVAFKEALYIGVHLEPKELQQLITLGSWFIGNVLISSDPEIKHIFRQI